MTIEFLSASRHAQTNIHPVHCFSFTEEVDVQPYSVHCLGAIVLLDFGIESLVRSLVTLPGAMVNILSGPV